MGGGGADSGLPREARVGGGPPAGGLERGGGQPPAPTTTGPKEGDRRTTGSGAYTANQVYRNGKWITIGYGGGK